MYRQEYTNSYMSFDVENIIKIPRIFHHKAYQKIFIFIHELVLLASKNS